MEYEDKSVNILTNQEEEEELGGVEEGLPVEEGVEEGAEVEEAPVEEETTEEGGTEENLDEEEV
ncbi:hypothetical protein KJ562_00490 [Patescibacteria group bacterium]|nr:hypothetical protein [Patescibacteria group bacterium]MBU4162042.1 hypothetical protein [Patescibacteria group bacterium]